MSFLSQQLEEFFRLQTYTGGLYCLFIDKYKSLDTFLFLANEKHSVNEVIVGCNALQNVLLKSMSRSYIICNKKIDIMFSRHFHSNPYCKFVVLNSIRKYLYYLYLLVINNCKLQLNNKQKSYALHRLVIYEFSMFVCTIQTKLCLYSDPCHRYLIQALHVNPIKLATQFH